MKTNTKRFLLLASLLLLFPSLFYCCKTKKKTQEAASVPIRFGIIADIQYADLAANNTRFYRNSLAKLEDCVRDLNQENVAFTLNLGDVVDKHVDELDSVLIRLNRLEQKVYNLSGNHDYGGVTDNAVLFEKLSMPSAYYSFKKGKWVFVMLDTNDVARYANIAGTEKEAELHAMRQRIEESGRNNGQNWNGGVGAVQMQWLDSLLVDAEKNGETVLLFSHHPFYPETMFTALNDKELLSLIKERPCVKAVFAGHHHSGEFAYFNDIPFTTLEGMVETESENAYCIIELYDDKILLNGRGRVKSREFKLK